MNLRAYLNHDYNWYRAPHKYLRQQLHNFIAKIGQTNFACFNSISKLNDTFSSLKELLSAHADHEDKAYHPLLNGTDLLEKVEAEHQILDRKFLTLQEQLNSLSFQPICTSSSPSSRGWSAGSIPSGSSLDPADQPRDDVRTDRNDMRISDENDVRISHKSVQIGYEFYSNFLNYYSEYQSHMLNEELVLMPTMRDLHGVNALRKDVTFRTYDHMSAEDMIVMLEHLIPVLNFQEKALLILDIYDGSQFHNNEKFKHVWDHIQNSNNILLGSEKREIEEVL